MYLSVLPLLLALSSSFMRTTYCTNEEEHVINPYNFRVISRSIEPCQPDDQLVVVIHSSVKVKAKVVYFLGRSLNTTIQDFIKYENELYRDMVQLDFIDHYLNNTYKAMSYLKWIHENCQNASILMKVDDDVLFKNLRAQRLRTIISDIISSGDPFYAGKFLNNIVVRAKGSKWYISPKVWPHDIYPTWFQGLVYFLSPNITGAMFDVALHTAYMHTDDVFVGILVDKLVHESNRTVFIRKLQAISVYTESKVGVKSLERYWRKGKTIFLHAPDPRLFWIWYSMDNGS